MGLKYENLRIDISDVPGLSYTVTDVTESFLVTLDFTDGPVAFESIDYNDFQILDQEGTALNNGEGLLVVGFNKGSPNRVLATVVAVEGSRELENYRLVFAPRDELFEDDYGNVSDEAFKGKLIAQVFIDTLGPVVALPIPNQIVRTENVPDDPATEDVNEARPRVLAGQLAFDGLVLDSYFGPTVMGSDPAVTQDATFTFSWHGDSFLENPRISKTGDGQSVFLVDLKDENVNGVVTVTITATDQVGHSVTDLFLVTRNERDLDTTPPELVGASTEEFPINVAAPEGFIVLTFNGALASYDDEEADEASLLDNGDLEIAVATPVTTTVDDTGMTVTIEDGAMTDSISLEVQAYGANSERVSVLITDASSRDYSVYTLNFVDGSAEDTTAAMFEDDAAETGLDTAAPNEFVVPEDPTIITFTIDTQAPTDEMAIKDQTLSSARATSLDPGPDEILYRTTTQNMTFRVTDENGGPATASIQGSVLTLTRAGNVL